MVLRFAAAGAVPLPIVGLRGRGDVAGLGATCALQHVNVCVVGVPGVLVSVSQLFRCILPGVVHER